MVVNMLRSLGVTELREADNGKRLRSSNFAPDILPGNSAAALANRRRKSGICSVAAIIYPPNSTHKKDRLLFLIVLLSELERLLIVGRSCMEGFGEEYLKGQRPIIKNRTIRTARFFYRLLPDNQFGEWVSTCTNGSLLSML